MIDCTQNPARPVTHVDAGREPSVPAALVRSLGRDELRILLIVSQAAADGLLPDLADLLENGTHQEVAEEASRRLRRALRDPGSPVRPTDAVPAVA